MRACLFFMLVGYLRRSVTAFRYTSQELNVISRFHEVGAQCPIYLPLKGQHYFHAISWRHSNEQTHWSGTIFLSSQTGQRQGVDLCNCTRQILGVGCQLHCNYLKSKKLKFFNPTSYNSFWGNFHVSLLQSHPHSRQTKPVTTDFEENSTGADLDSPKLGILQNAWHN